MQISWSGKRNNGGTLMQFGPVFSKKERKSRYKSNFQRVSLRKQVCLWICRAKFLQRVFQFGFLNTVETLSFFSLKSSSEFVLHCEKFISFLASPPIYRSKFQLCTTAWSIIIFMRTALSCLCFFLNPEAEIMPNMLFNTLLKWHHTIYKKEEEVKKEQSMDLHDDIRGGSPIQFLTPPNRA